MKKLAKSFIAFSLLLVSICGNISSVKQVFAAESEQLYPVLEDAYIRSGRNANKNYNYENITKAHGAQYDGKNYKVVNTKHYQNNDQIISVLKFNLPNKEEVATQGFDTYELEFQVFKNPDSKNGDQTYQFFYSKDVNWKETEITWNNKPESISPSSSDLLCEFEIKQNTDYEHMEEQDKKIQLDVSSQIAIDCLIK